MMSSLEINGRAFLSIKEAAQQTTYSRDYITRLAREEKITASYIGRQWFVDVDSLRQYAEQSLLEQEARKRQLSHERKQERLIREATEALHTVHVKKAKTLHRRAVAVSAVVLGVGLMGGVTSYYTFPTTAALSVLSPEIPREQSALTAEAKYVKEGAADAELLPSASLEVAATTLAPIGTEAGAGVLLLPREDVEVSAVPALFSDHVLVRESAEGETEVVPVDVSGKVIGSPIPFVIVPVSTDES